MLALILKAVKALRVTDDAEVGGIDIADHGETAYDLTSASGSSGGAFAMAGLNPGAPAASKADQKVAG